MRRQATWHMSEVELAHVWADHFGYTGRPGGWIYSPAGRPVAHGWAALARELSSRGWIREGSGINWRACGERPTIARVTR
jgi:hypothetical protein